MWRRLKLAPFLLIATLMIVVGCSMLTPRANANGPAKLTLTSKHQTSSLCINLGMIDFRGGVGTVYALPTTLNGPFTDAQATFIPASGCAFVRWEITGDGNKLSDPNSVSTRVDTQSTGTLTAIYSGVCCPVGGVVTSTNTFTLLAPYLAMIGLIATAFIAVKKRRK